MKVQMAKVRKGCRALGDLQGGDCCRLPMGTEIYMRLTGASSKLGVSDRLKVLVNIRTGSILVHPYEKEVYQVQVEAKEEE